MRWAGHKEMRNKYILVGKPERKLEHWRHSHIWKENLKVELKELG
jgi:hypothetical protein